MKYYLIEEDKNIVYKQKVDILKENYYKEEVIVKFVENDKIYYKEYPDFLRTPFLTVSNQFKNIINSYCDNIFWEPLLLVDLLYFSQELYWYIPNPIHSSYIHVVDEAIQVSKNVPYLLKNAIITYYDTSSVYNNIIQYRGYVNQHKMFLREDIVEHFLDESIYGATFTSI